MQLHPVEAWDLLSILSNGNEEVLGGTTKTSRWFSSYRTIQIAWAPGMDIDHDGLPDCRGADDNPLQRSTSFQKLQFKANSSRKRPAKLV